MYSIDLDVARHIGRAFPDLTISCYESFAEYCYEWMSGELDSLTLNEAAQYCGVEGKEHLLDTFQEFLNATDAKIIHNELNCSDRDVFECLIAIYQWMDA